MNKRQLSIINLLLGKDLKVITLAKLFKVSTRTIRNDIDKINFQFEELSVSKIKNNRGSLSLSLTLKEKAILMSNFQQSESTYLSPSERILTIILDTLKAPRKIKIYKEKYKLGVSKSTMDKDVRAVRQYLSTFDLKLDAQNGVEILGGEKRIRTMLLQLIPQNVNLIKLMSKENDFEKSISYNMVLDYLGRENIPVLNRLSNQLLNQNLDKYKGDEAIKAQISFCLAIWLKRVSQGNFLENNFNSALKINSSIKKTIIKFLSKRKLKVPEIEVSYISYIINVFGGKEKYNLAELTRAQLLTIRLINYMSKAESIDYQNSEQLYEQLNSHILAFLNREENKVKIFNPLTSVLKNNYGRIFEDVNSFFKENYDGDPSDGEKAYITIYFGTYYEKISKLQKTYRIAVLCNYGEATGQLLAANLSNNFNSDIVAVLGVHDLNVLSKINIDFVVKTIDIQLKVPSIKLPLIPTNEDYRRLSIFANKLPIKFSFVYESESNKTLLKDLIDLTERDLHVKVNSNYVDSIVRLLNANHINISEKEVRPLLEDLLTSKKILLNINAKNWKEAIEKSSVPLLTEGAIDQSYVKAMEDSVKQYGPYIVIGPHIALAHARPEAGVHKLDVSVATLKNPVKFGNEQNDPVEIIFVLAAVDNYSHLNILKAIVNLINDPEKIKRLCSLNDVNSFKRVLFNK